MTNRTGLAGALLLAALAFTALRVHAQSNGVLREVYMNIGGGAVADLTNNPAFPDNPSLDEVLTNSFEAPSDVLDNYGQRLRALLLPPVTGSYTFWIASDDGGLLFLSTDDTPARKLSIARVNSWTSSRQWFAEPNQQSAPVTLTAGQRYYIEALQKEGGGGDNLAVAWQKPGDPLPSNGSAPIPATYLVPYGMGPPQITVQPTNVTVVEGGSATFSVQLARSSGAVFQWLRNGTNIPGATARVYSLSSLRLADSNSLFRCFIANGFGATNSANALLTVVPDTTRPVLSSVGNLGERQIVFVIFSEPVEAASATNAGNYTINGSLTVRSAAFGADARTIILTTSLLTPELTYTLTVNNVRDRASTPNTILPNSQMTFSVRVRPIDVGYLSLPREPIGPSSRRHGVVISEVMYHPTNRADGRNLEFLELHNSQPWFEEIGGWRISGAVDYVFPSNAVVPARSFLVVAANPADFRAAYTFTNVFGPFAGSNGLQNSSGTLRLRNSRDAVLFEMNYSGDPPLPAAADGAGHSLVLARPSYGERDPRAWAASDLVGGNPGAADTAGSNPYRTILINEFLAHTDLPQVDFIELYNYGNASVNLAGCVLTDDPATNKFIVPSNTVLQARGFIAFTETQLGFALSAAGEKIFLKNPAGTRVIDSVSFDAQENGVSLGRWPDGAPAFSRLATPTPGTNNAPVKTADVVISEIMFDPITSDGNDEYVELFNRGTNAVNLGGWRLRDAVSFNIPGGTVLPAGSWLVIAKNAARLRTNCAGLGASNCLGDYDGGLANGGERIELNMPDRLVSTNALGQPLTNTIHITMDEVTYGPGGRWGKWAGGGGSSLELRDARADRRLAPNWADSDESAKSPWATVEATGVMDNGYADAYQLHVTLQGAGECLLDNVEVIPTGSSNVIGNGTFESGAGGWVFQGNHNQTSWEPAEGYSSARSLHLRATGRGDTGANRVRVQLPYTLSPGTTVTLRAKARWLKGNPNLLLRLRGNWLEAPGYILAAKNLGTPGAANSRAIPNAGPAITDARHDPPLPAAGQPVLVLARVNDPDGLAYLAVNYRLDPGTNYLIAAMTNNGAGLYSMVIPGQAAGTTAAFYVQAVDNFAPPAASRFPDNAPARECVVRWGDTTVPGNGSVGTYRFWITQTNIDRWVAEEKMSNNPKDVTFIYGASRVIYNAGAMFHGSPYHSPGYNSPVGNLCDYDMIFPEDDRLLGETDINLFMPGNGGGDGTAQAEVHAYWFGGQFGAPFLYHRPVFLFANGQQRNNVFYDAQQPNGDFVDQWFPDDSGGDLHKIQIGFEFGDLAYGASEPGYAAVGADLSRYVTTGSVFKQARYRQTWPLRSASPSQQNDYTNIFALVNSAQTTAPLGSEAYSTALNNATDVEEWFKIHVTQHLCNNYDSFSYGGGQNAFAYKPEHDTWKLLLWDVDFAFGGSATDPALFNGGGAEHGPRNNHPPFTRLYWQALIEAANGMMTAARSNPILDARYSGMTAGGASVGSPQGIKDFIAARRIMVLSTITSNQSAFAMTSNGGADFTTNRNLITLAGTAPLDVRAILVNGVAYPITWTTVSNWGLRVPLASGTNTLLIAGVDPRGARVAGVNATLRVNYTGANERPQDKLVINEIMYNPLVPGASFVELYNTSVSNAFDLSHWRLSGLDHVIADGTIIEPGQYLLFVKDRYVFGAAYGANIPIADEFVGSLGNGRETLTLFKPGTRPAPDQIIAQVTYDSAAPWPTDANGTGASLQLIDPAQDHNRVGNWSAVPTNAPLPPPQWQYVTASGTASSSSLYVYLQTAGDVYLDDLKLVAGNVPEAGANVLGNGGFETAFPGPWVVSPNHAASATSSAIKRSGNFSLHLLASSGGTTRASSIYQDITPALAVGQPYTLSFWYLPSTNGGPLTFRLSGSGIRADVNIAPGGGATGLARVTPGAANSVRTVLPPFPKLWLNETQPNNVNGQTDRFGHLHPWAELYNGETNAINLGGCFLANNYTNLAQWAFPSNTVLSNGQFLVVWLDGNVGESTNTELHTSFTVPPEAGSLCLAKTNSGQTNLTILDYLNYVVSSAGRSYGDYPDGNGSTRQTFSIATPGGTNDPTGAAVTVFINEWMADNTATLADPADGDFEDWIELYNPGTNAVDLSGYYLTDTLTNQTKWLIPPGTLIPAGGYLLVWADDETSQNGPGREPHMNFKLRASGQAIGLFAEGGATIDAVVFSQQTNDVSMGRFPDGQPSLNFMTTPTPRSANFVAAPNYAPTLTSIGNKTVNEGSLLTFTATASDFNVPAQNLSFSLGLGTPAGASINASNGVFRWVPNEAQGPGNYTITVLVTDDGVPPLSDSQTFSIQVNEVNNPPVLATLSTRTVTEGTTLTITNSATDPDTPAQSLTYSLDPGAPPGMTINSINGLLTWTPAEDQGPGNYSVTVRVTDNGTPPLSDTKPLTVVVNELNTAPVLAAIPNQTNHLGCTFTFLAMATDPDLPANLLSFSLPFTQPVNAAIDPVTGRFSWTPTPAQAPSTNLLAVLVSDNGSPSLAANRLFYLVVLSPLVVTPAVPSPGVLTLTWTSIPARSYQVQTKTNLAEMNWTSLGSTVTASGPVSSATNSLGTTRARFYRVTATE